MEYNKNIGTILKIKGAASMNKNAMFNLGYGLYVLSARSDGKDNGCIVNTVMQVTDTPLRVMIVVNKKNYTHRMMMETRECTVSMLTEDTPFELIKQFGFQSGRDVEKFDGSYQTERGRNSLLHLKDYVNGYLNCKLVETTDLGTHTMFLAEVTDADVLGTSPSLTYAYYHKHTKPKAPAPAATAEKKPAWRCKICGYIYEGDPLPEDYICPLCKHGAGDFEKVEI